MDEGGVGIGGVAAASEDIKQRDSVTRGKPVGNGDGEGKCCVVAMRGEDENLQGVAPAACISILRMWPLGRDL